MQRRDFLKSMTALAAGGAVSAPAIWSQAKAQSRQETLLIVSESGPNNIDIHGVGTNVPGYEVSWNCYDRLISHEMKTVDGTPYYDRDKFKMELADDMSIGDMSVTFKLKRNAKFQDGTPVTASVGVSERLADGVSDWSTLVEIADQRMYEAKQRGRDRWISCADPVAQTAPPTATPTSPAISWSGRTTAPGAGISGATTS
mgnify:CR=1 FL=1